MSDPLRPTGFEDTHWGQTRDALLAAYADDTTLADPGAETLRLVVSRMVEDMEVDVAFIIGDAGLRLISFSARL